MNNITIIAGGAIVLLLILAAIGAFGWYIYMKARFKTVPSNRALVITGPNLGDPAKDPGIYKDAEGRHMKIVRGGGYRMKMFQSASAVSLSSFQLHIKTPLVYTKQGVGIRAEAVATVKVADTLDGIVKYAEQFLGKEQETIENEVSEVLNTNLRAILSKMTVEEINSDREGFNLQVTEIAQQQLNNMGFEITSLGLSDITDDEGYLENLGKPQIAQVKKEADIAESNAKRETELKIAENKEITEKAVFSREINIAESRRSKELKDKQVLSEINKAAAEAEASGLLAQEAQKLEIQQKTNMIDAKRKENELHLEQMQKTNEVELQKQIDDVRRQQAETDAIVKERKAKADAASRLDEGRADAEVIRLKAQAEADGIREKAKALSENQGVMLQELMIKMMPEFARAVSEPLSNVESIRIMGSEGEAASLSADVIKMMVNAEEGFNQMTGFNMSEFLKNKAEHRTAITVNEASENHKDTEDAKMSTESDHPL